MRRPLIPCLLLALAAGGCISPTRELTIGQNPDTGLLEIHAANSWFGGPVEGDVEFKAPDGTYFKGHFGANADLDPAVEARLAQEANLRDLLARLEALARLAAAAYGAPIPGAPPVAAPAASQPAR